MSKILNFGQAESALPHNSCWETPDANGGAGNDGIAGMRLEPRSQ